MNIRRIVRLQISLRAAFAILTILCIFSAWMGHRLDAARKQAQAVDAILALDGSVQYRFQNDPVKEQFYLFREVPIPMFLRELLGDHFFCRPIYVNGPYGNFTDDSLKFVGELSSLETLSLGENPISDDGLVHLQGLVNLKGLGLDGTKITDAGLKHLAKLRSLESLSTYGTGVTSEGILELKKSLPSLRVDNEDWLSKWLRRGRE